MNMHAIRHITGAAALAAVLAMGGMSVASADVIPLNITNDDITHSENLGLVSVPTQYDIDRVLVNDPAGTVDFTTEDGGAGAGVIEDTYTFTIDTIANLSAALITFNFGDLDLDIASLELFDDGLSIAVDNTPTVNNDGGLTSASLTLTALGLDTASTYTLVVGGTVLSSLGADYNLSMTIAPIPVPAALLLFISGIMVLFGAGKVRGRGAAAA